MIRNEEALIELVMALTAISLLTKELALKLMEEK